MSTLSQGPELQIDELVLHGYPAEFRYAVADVMERELAALIRVHGWPCRKADGKPRVVPAISLALPEDATREEVGRLAARQLYLALEQLA
jgi:hypothetical protein